MQKQNLESVTRARNRVEIYRERLETEWKERNCTLDFNESGFVKYTKECSCSERINAGQGTFRVQYSTRSQIHVYLPSHDRLHRRRWHLKKVSVKVKPFGFERCLTRMHIDYKMVFQKSADWKSEEQLVHHHDSKSMIFQRANLKFADRNLFLSQTFRWKCLSSPNVWRQIEVGSWVDAGEPPDARQFKVTPQLEYFNACSANTDKTTAAGKAQHKYLRCDNSNFLIAFSVPSFCRCSHCRSRPLAHIDWSEFFSH